MPLKKEKTLILSGDDVIRIVDKIGIHRLMDILIRAPNLRCTKFRHFQNGNTHPFGI